MAGRGTWVSASDLADYAFCPRSHFYHEHPPDGGPDPAAEGRARSGRAFHARELGGERRRAEHGAAYWGAFFLGALLAVGAILWIFHP